MTKNPETDLRALHDTYCRLTGRSLNFRFYQREWYDYASNGFTSADLETTLRWIERENSKREKRFAIRTELLRIIGDLAVFDSLKAEAELADRARAAKKRQPVASTGEIALSQMRREPEPDKSGEPAKRISLDFIADSLKGAKQ